MIAPRLTFTWPENIRSYPNSTIMNLEKQLVKREDRENLKWDCCAKRKGLRSAGSIDRRDAKFGDAVYV